MIEEKDRLVRLLTAYMEEPGLTVVIGSEHISPDLQSLSLVAHDLRRRPAHGHDRHHGTDPDALLARHRRRRERLARDAPRARQRLTMNADSTERCDRTARCRTMTRRRPEAEPRDRRGSDPRRRRTTALQEDPGVGRARSATTTAIACCARAPSSTTTASASSASAASSPSSLRSELLKDLLPLVDDLERALAATPAGDTRGRGRQLSRRRRADPPSAARAAAQARRHADRGAGRRLRPARPPGGRRQEASTSHRDGEVIEELRRGYKLGDRLLRPAMVKVATRE